MSMFWSGDRILGLILCGDEVEDFIDSYIEYHRNDERLRKLTYEECRDEVRDCLYLDDLNNIETWYLSDDGFEGVHFDPVNVCNLRSNWHGYIDEEFPIVFVWADKQPTTNALLTEGFYKSYDQIEAEFKQKIGKYVPNDFPWSERIGDISYACYA